MRYLLHKLLFALLLTQNVCGQGGDFNSIMGELFIDGKQGGNETNANVTNVTDVGNATEPTLPPADNTTTVATTAPDGTNPNATAAPDGTTAAPETTAAPDGTTAAPDATSAPTNATIDGTTATTAPTNMTDTTTTPPPDQETEAPTAVTPPGEGTEANVTRPPEGEGTDANATRPDNATTTAPVAPPVAAPTSTPAPVPAGATRQQINARFVVSNLEGIESIARVNNSGLWEAWGPFVEDVVQKTKVQEGHRLRRLSDHEQQQHRRRLRVDFEPDSAYIYDIVLKSDCGPDTHPDLTCHDAYGTYSLLLYEQHRQDARDIEQLYGTATVDAINDGELYTKLKEVDPESPLYIGTVGEPKSGGIATWLLVLIILLVLLCLCCILGALFWLLVLKKKDDDDPKSEPYDEEGFAYDFLIPTDQKVQTEVDDEVDDDDDTDNEELFEDDDPKGENLATAPATIMEDDDEEDNAINVTAEVTDEDEESGDERKPLVAGDDVDSDDDGLTPLSNEMEESGHGTENWDDESGLEKQPSADADEDWDEEGGSNAGSDGEEWEDEDEEKKK